MLTESNFYQCSLFCENSTSSGNQALEITQVNSRDLQHVNFVVTSGKICLKAKTDMNQRETKFAVIFPMVIDNKVELFYAIPLKISQVNEEVVIL